MSTTPEFRRHRARLAANTRHHPDRTEDDRRVLDAASREQKLRDVLGAPPAGSNWIDEVCRVVDAAPPLTAQQRETLRLLLHPVASRGTTMSAGDGAPRDARTPADKLDA